MHVLDTNTNVARVEVGPKTFTCLEHEKVVYGPTQMIIVPPRHYVIIDNPAIRKKKPKTEISKWLQINLDKLS